MSNLDTDIDTYIATDFYMFRTSMWGSLMLAPITNVSCSGRNLLQLHFYWSVVSCLYNISVSVVYSDKGQGSGLDHLDWELMAKVYRDKG